MTVYLDVVIALNFLVDLLLLLGTNRLCGYPPGLGRALLAAGIGGIYGGVCMLPEFHFLGNTLWRGVSLCMLSWVAFGLSKSALRRGAIFLLLSMALGGVTLGFRDRGLLSVIAAAAAIFIICTIGFRGKIGSSTYVPVELNFGAHSLRLTALQDTGNQLTDPVTGRPVLVIAAEAAEKLTGLTRQQLSKPAEAILTAKMPGLRLIPYYTVGQPGGMLLGVRMQDVKIGNWKGSSLVAFAPDALSREGAYQALTGGVA